MFSEIINDKKNVEVPYYLMSKYLNTYNLFMFVFKEYNSCEVFVFCLGR